MSHVSTATQLACSSGISAHVDSVMAAEHVAEQLRENLGGGSADLVVLFVSGSHVRDTASIASVLRTALEPGTLIGVTGEGVLGREQEIERRGGVSAFAASLPGTTLHPFSYQDIPHAEPDDEHALDGVARAIGLENDSRGVMLFADPFSVPTPSVVASLSAAVKRVGGMSACPVFGGVASASKAPGGNMLVLNDSVRRAGGVGVTISGAVTIDMLVSQGCRTIGPPMVVTEGRRNVIAALAGRRALDVLRELVEGLDEQTRELVTRGMFVGRVVDEYKPRFGRGDFLIRAVMNIDRESGSILVGDSVRTGQTIQFHVPHAETASEDLRLLLAGQQLRKPPAGGLLITCNGRGAPMFGAPNHDAGAVAEALRTDADEPVPVAGFFAAGEIAPLGAHSYVHGYTASLAMFRERRRSLDTP